MSEGVDRIQVEAGTTAQREAESAKLPAIESTAERRQLDPLALFATILAAVALLVSIWQGIEARRAARAGLWPHLEIEWEFMGNRPSGLAVNNRGVGPFVVKWLKVYADGERVEVDEHDVWVAAVNRLGTPNVEYRMEYSWFLPGVVVSPGQHVRLIGVPTQSEAPSSLDLMTNLFRRGGVAVCYCSVFDDCRLASTGVLPRELHWCDGPRITGRSGV